MKWPRLRERGCFVRKAKEEQLSVAEMAQEKEQVRGAEGLEEGKYDLCEYLICVEERRVATPVWEVSKIKLMTE